MTTLTEKAHPGSFIVSEKDPFYCREAIVVAESQEFDPGTVLGRSAVGANVTSSAAAAAGNTGNGAFTLDPTTPVLEGAKNGKYRAVCVEPAAGAGTFEVFDPSGKSIGRHVVAGAAFATEIKFTIADGATDFVAGDAFEITVGIEQADYQYKALDLTDAGEAAAAAGIAVYGAKTGAGETQKITGMVRGPAEVRLADLVMPSGATAAQSAEIVRQLDAIGIVCR